jgi:hypothetical protein
VALWGPFPELCGRSCLLGTIDRAGGKAKQLLISLLVSVHLTNEQKERSGEALRQGTTGGFRVKNS